MPVIAGLESSRRRSSKASISLLRSFDTWNHSASFVRLRHFETEPFRDANYSPTADATLLVPQPSNPAPLDLVLSALLFQMKQLSSELALRYGAQSAAITAVSDRFNRLERSRSDRSDRESANVQSSVPLLHKPATVVVESRVSRRDRVHTAPEDAILDPMRYCGRLPVPSASHSNESDWNRRETFCPFLLPFDRHAGFVANALPPPHAAFASLPPPPLTQPLPSNSSVPLPMPSLPFAHKSDPSLALPSVSLPCSISSMLPSTFQSYPNAVAGIAWDATDRETF